ncbi:MAG: hypothetical protein ACUVS4_15610 [Chloroflexaceae bacterium]
MRQILVRLIETFVCKRRQRPSVAMAASCRRQCNRLVKILERTFGVAERTEHGGVPLVGIGIVRFDLDGPREIA